MTPTTKYDMSTRYTFHTKVVHLCNRNRCLQIGKRYSSAIRRVPDYSRAAILGSLGIGR